MYKHIIWDWNGTLLDDVDLSLEAINIVLARYDRPALQRKRYLKIFTFPVIEYYKTLGFDFNKTPFNIIGTEFIDEYTARMFDVELNSGAREFLDSVQQTNITQSLLSAAKQQMLEKLIEYHKLQDYFIRIIGLDNHYAYSKLEAGQAWMAELPFQPSEVLYIGDTIHDVDVARELGVDIALLALGHTSYSQLVGTGQPVFRNFSELSNWFHALYS